MPRSLRIVFLFAGLTAAAVFAQDLTRTRSVHGTVRDSAGRPVKGAVVQIENTKSLQIRSYVTKGDGDYDFHGLSTDIDYQISAAYQGKRSDQKMLSRFDSKTDAKIDLQLPS